MPDNTNYLLILSFDFEQITESLDYSIVRVEDWDPTSEGSINHNLQGPQILRPLSSGKNAGTFNFNKGDTLSVMVMGFTEAKDRADKSQYGIVDIANCSLVSIAEEGVVPLSLFNVDNAIANFAEWTPFKWQYKDYITFARASSVKETIVVDEGQWKISGYLSIKLLKDGQQKSKLYYFDPEGSAGGGGPIPQN